EKLGFGSENQEEKPVKKDDITENEELKNNQTLTSSERQTRLQQNQQKLDQIQSIFNSKDTQQQPTNNNFPTVKDKNFLRTFRDELNGASAEFPAYFWECIPVSSNTIDKEFEFVLVNSGALNNIRQDYSSFQEHFRKSNDGQAVSFSSFSGDTLIVPVPQGADYKNITKFTNNTSLEQWNALWQKVGEKMEENLINAGGATR
ncbi:8543_t:CDS:2, partial [Ambispora leptoticha]